MKFEAALKSMQDGNKVRRKRWYTERYVYLSNKFHEVMNNDNDDINFCLERFLYDDVVATDWEIFKEPWKPRKGQKYWFIDMYLTVHGAHNLSDSYDTKLIDIGNCFSTEKEAEFAADKIKKLLKELEK